MSLVDKLKSVFIVPDSNSEIIKDIDSKQVGADSSANGLNSNSEDPSPESKEKFADILSQVLQNNNKTGFDYLEYSKAVQSIAKMQNMPEEAQFKTAFAAAMSMNIQPTQLIDSAKSYISILETEFTKFNQTASQFLQTQVSSKEQESSQLKQTIQQKEQQLAQLQADLEKNHKRLIDIDAELKSAKAKVDTNKSSFKLAYDQLVGQINSDIQKMEQYLK